MMGSLAELLYFHSLRYLERDGGVLAIASAPSLEEISRLCQIASDDAIWVHRVVRTLLQMHRTNPLQTGTDRAIYIAKRTAEFDGDRGERRIARTWKAYANCCHIVYALVEYELLQINLTTGLFKKWGQAAQILPAVKLAHLTRERLGQIHPFGRQPGEAVVDIELMGNPKTASIWSFPSFSKVVDEAEVNEMNDPLTLAQEALSDEYRPSSGLRVTS